MRRLGLLDGLGHQRRLACAASPDNCQAAASTALQITGDARQHLTAPHEKAQALFGKSMMGEALSI